MSDERKAPLDLIPLRALVGASRVFQHGNTRPKPGTDIPRAPGDFIERKLGGNFYASLLRHVMDAQELNGVVTPESLAKRDHDSGLPVIDHIICNALIIRTMLIRDGKLSVDPGMAAPAKAREAFFRAAEGVLPPGPEHPNCRCVAEFDAELDRCFGDVGPTVEPCTSLNPCASCRRNQ